MIKELTDITGRSIIKQGTENEIKVFSSIKFDNAVGAGAFGQVFELIELDEKPVKHLLVKVYLEEEKSQHAHEAITLLHQKINKELLNQEQSIYQLYPGLLGLPFSVFRAKETLENKRVTALIMFDLRKKGYYEINKDSNTILEKLDLIEKFQIAFQVSKTFNFLHRKQFIHSDLDFDALWYNPVKKHLAIIDYDSGFNYTIQKKPTTLGKINHFASVLWRKILQVGTGASSPTTEESIAEENWKLASALFEILFDVTPFFFLADAEESTFHNYLKNNKWPLIKSSTSDYINRKNIPYHGEFIQKITDLESMEFKPLIDHFKQCFNQGFNTNSKRPDAFTWFTLLKTAAKASELIPEIELFNPDKTIIYKKNELVNFTIQGVFVDYFRINGDLVPLFSHSVIKKFSDTEVVKLQAINDIGVAEKEVKISAVQINPVINEVRVSETIRKSLDPITIWWSVTNAEYVRIQGFPEQYPSTGKALVNPTQLTVYVLEAIGNFGQSVNYSVTIDVVMPSIVDFDWKVDINKGLNNVKIYWETEYATECTITPKLGQVNINGALDVKIKNRTEFELLVKGLFGQISRKIEAVPFDAPFIENIFVEAPTIELSSKLDIRPINIDTSIPLLLLKNVQLNTDFNFQTITEPIEIVFNKDLPDFRYGNDLLPETNPAWIQKNIQKIKNKIINLIFKQI